MCFINEHIHIKFEGVDFRTSAEKMHKIACIFTLLPRHLLMTMKLLNSGSIVFEKIYLLWYWNQQSWKTHDNAMVKKKVILLFSLHTLMLNGVWKCFFQIICFSSYSNDVKNICEWFWKWHFSIKLYIHWTSGVLSLIWWTRSLNHGA